MPERQTGSQSSHVTPTDGTLTFAESTPGIRCTDLCPFSSSKLGELDCESELYLQARVHFWCYNKSVFNKSLEVPAEAALI